MKRASLERQPTVRLWRQHLAWHGPGPLARGCESQVGRFRKGQRVGGCGRSRCCLCHGDKLLKRPTLEQRRSASSYGEWVSELGQLHEPLPNHTIEPTRLDAVELPGSHGCADHCGR